MPENNEQPAAPAPTSEAPATAPAPEAPVAPVAPAPAATPVAPAAPAPAAPVAPVAPKQPMDPAKKKKIILFSCIGGGVLVLGIVAAIVIPMLLRVDYGEAYNLAKQAKESLSSYYNDSDCYYANYYLDSKYTSESSYDSYLEDCKKSVATAPTEIVEKLGNTRAITSNPEIKAQYDKFYAEFKKEPIDDTGTMETRLALYKAWHTFIVKSYDLSTGATDANIAAAAASLVNSSDSTLKAYGEAWITKRIAYARAYTKWWETPGYTNEYSQEKSTAYDDLTTFEEENEPAFVKVANETTSNSSSVYTEFKTLFNLLADAYELNYNWGSNDCLEMQVLNTVYCDM